MKKSAKMIKRIIFFTFLLNTAYIINAQEYNFKRFTVSRAHTFYPESAQSDYQPMLYHLEAPVPDGNSYRSFLMQQKIKSREHFDNQRFKINKKMIKSDHNVAVPSVGLEFIPSRLVGQNLLPLAGGIPSDNTLAVSNDGILLLAMNSFIYAHDIAADTAIFQNYRITLNAVAGGSPFSSYYDPKLYYDPMADRFILTFLLGNQPDNSKVIMCFSQTNNPNDGWHVYILPGNPLDNNRWTDFPSIAITEDYVYFTANLIIPDVSWQIGFDGSIIWRADKQAGFAGDDIEAVLFSDIRFDGRFIRNLNPVQGANGIADEMFLLSNRNFDIENDTIFLVRVAGDTLLEIHALKTDMPYGLPPNARQFNTNPSNPIYGLQTNDARVLAAIQFCDQIQFTANTINPETGFCAIYHGIINNYKEQPFITGNIIGDTVMDLGYPNIAWTGNEECDREVIIGFNLTSFDHFPGVGAIYMNNQGNYSPILIVKEGLNYVQRLSGSYQRWGDFSGLQRKYNERNKVYAFGFLALEDKKNGGYCYELNSPDTSTFRLHLQLTRKDICNNTLAVQVFNGTPPYSFSWNHQEFISDNTFTGLCSGDTLFLAVKDVKGCFTETQYIVPAAPLPGGTGIYPNPAWDMAAIQFSLEQNAVIRAEIFNTEGKLITTLFEAQAKKGLNEFTFSTQPLSEGMYVLVLYANGKIIESHKIIKTSQY